MSIQRCSGPSCKRWPRVPRSQVKTSGVDPGVRPPVRHSVTSGLGQARSSQDGIGRGMVLATAAGSPLRKRSRPRFRWCCHSNGEDGVDERVVLVAEHVHAQTTEERLIQPRACPSAKESSRRMAQVAICTRLVRPSLFNTCPTCDSIVLRLMTSSAALCGLVSPRATSIATSRSRTDSQPWSANSPNRESCTASERAMSRACRSANCLASSLVPNTARA